jgi:hypothetical protein
MKQVYNLLETIEQDKLHVAKLKKQLHHAESILEAHTAALTRLTTIPKLPQPKAEKVDYSSTVETRERITKGNYKSLNIQKGDKVDLVKGIYACNEKGVQTVYGVDFFDEDLAIEVCYPEEEYGTYWISLDDEDEDDKLELYLIRTKEESLND